MRKLGTQAGGGAGSISRFVFASCGACLRALLCLDCDCGYSGVDVDVLLSPRCVVLAAARLARPRRRSATKRAPPPLQQVRSKLACWAGSRSRGWSGGVSFAQPTQARRLRPDGRDSCCRANRDLPQAFGKSEDVTHQHTAASQHWGDTEAEPLRVRSQADGLDGLLGRIVQVATIRESAHKRSESRKQFAWLGVGGTNPNGPDEGRAWQQQRWTAGHSAGVEINTELK